jgi:hypothetical protein
MTSSGNDRKVTVWWIIRCDAHRDWMLDLDADCPDPCEDCVYTPADPAVSHD